MQDMKVEVKNSNRSRFLLRSELQSDPTSLFLIVTVQDAKPYFNFGNCDPLLYLIFLFSNTGNADNAVSLENSSDYRFPKFITYCLNFCLFPESMLCFAAAQTLVKIPLVFTLTYCCYSLIKLAHILCRLLLLRVPNFFISVQGSCFTPWLYTSNSAVSSLRYRDWNYMQKLCFVEWMP